MEEEKKKKKNKKKKCKQTKTPEDVGVHRQTVTLEQHYVDETKQNHDIEGSSNVIVQNLGTNDLDAKPNCHRIDEVNGVSSIVLLEEEVRQLEAEKQSWLQRQKHLEEKVKQAIMDKHSWTFMEVNLQEKIMHLQNEKDCSLQAEADLKEKIKQLEKEIDSRGQKEASLDEIIKQLESEKSSWAIKEADFEERIKHLEGYKDSWLIKENSFKDMVARLNEVNVGLQTQVKEFEESKKDILQENQQLVESISLLELRIQHLEKEGSASSSAETTKHINDEDPNSLVEAAQALVEKLIVENAELVEKVNELYVELDRRGTTSTQSSMVGFNPAMVMSRTATDPGFFSERGEEAPSTTFQALQFPTSIQNGEAVKVVGNTDLQSNFDAGIQKDEPLGSLKSSESTSDIVEVPLSENEIREVVTIQNQPKENYITDVMSESLEAGENAGVPLSDAPLIGAPFRLISFVAGYVSGADLVNKNSSGSGS